MKTALTYDDVYLVPNYSTLTSRSEADTSLFFGNRYFDLPLIPANMETVIDYDLYTKLSQRNIFCIMHRFGDNPYFMFETENSSKFRYKSISIGVNQPDIDFLKRLFELYQIPDYITIDIAHGHHSKVREAIRQIKEFFPEPFLIVGNVTTPEAVENLQSWGADAIKVGVGPGKACTTRLQTGFHVPMFTAVQDCAAVAKVPIIADGGIHYYGDIAKALVAGATMVMCGSLFASCSDSPAPSVNGRKIYYGSASFEAKKENRHVEGTLLELEPSITIEEKLNEIKEALQSSISYAGGHNLSCFNSVKYVIKK
jgi:GMP reductase